ncbi:YxiJ family protein, partial [Bacillus sp. JJ664]
MLSADLSTYWMTINASLNYIIKGKTKDIYQKNLIDLLNVSFFDYFDQYKFLEAEIENYPNFYSEYIIHEQTRIYILHY